MRNFREKIPRTSLTMDSQLLHRTLTKINCMTQLKLYTKLRQAEYSTNIFCCLCVSVRDR